MKNNFGIEEKILYISKKAEEKIKEKFLETEQIAEFNQAKLLESFVLEKVSYDNFAPTSGYGYDDFGREALEKIYSKIFRCEDALVRCTIVSGTHAISLCLFGVLRPTDKLLCLAGPPYETVASVIGANENTPGSLKEWGIDCEVLNLDSRGKVQHEKIFKALMHIRPKAVLIQRSKGYNFRPSISIYEIEKIIKKVKVWDESCICIVDNCYGEFVETKEPTEVGADLVAGSLIKNIGGGLAECGGYVVGKKEYIDKVSYQLTAAGIGKHVGSSPGPTKKNMYQGLFNAPHAVGQSIKTALYCSEIFTILGFETEPKTFDKRTDIVQAIKFENKKLLLSFCQEIQNNSPVDSHLTLMPSKLPGYYNDIIMASGAFVQGSSIELSADAPMTPPYVAYVQGGTVFESSKIAILKAANSILKLI